MNELKDYIVVMNNIIPPPVADLVLSEYKNSGEWISAVVGDGEKLDVRNCQTIGMSSDFIINKNQELRKKIDLDVYNSAFQAMKEYRARFPTIKSDQDSGYDLLKYETGGFYIQHTDFHKTMPRTVSCSFALNDDYEGGEFAFFNRELVYKLKKGSCIMFPSNFMYPHEIMPVTSGTRYSIVTWFV